jgi:ketosteroid isomerase-like protein
MRAGARTPEELETLFEDAFVVRDRVALAELFEEGAVLVAPDAEEARGTEQIGRLATAMWERESSYLTDPQTVLQARDTALVVAQRGINVVRRGSDGAWRYAISLLTLGDTTTKEER